MSSNTANRVQAFLGRAKLICSNSESQDPVSPQQSSASPKLRDRTPQVPAVSLSKIIQKKPRGSDSKSSGHSTGGNSPSNGKASPSLLSPRNLVSPLRSNITTPKDPRLSPKPKTDLSLTLRDLSPSTNSSKQQAKDSIAELESIIESLSKKSVAIHQKVQDGLKTDSSTVESFLSILDKEKSKVTSSDRSAEL